MPNPPSKNRFTPFYLIQTKKYLADHGFLSTVKTIFCFLLFAASKYLKTINPRYFDEYSFDFRHGTDTEQVIGVKELKMDPALKNHAVQYEPTRAWLFADIMDKVKVDFRNFSFVDFGSGKGRVLLLASKFPFKRIIGIEASPELCQCAQNNIERYRANDQRCKNITSLCINAQEFEIPECDTILYFYNPFDAHILQPILNHIEDHCQNKPFRVIIIYTNPVHFKLFEQSKFFQLMVEDERYKIFCSNFRYKNLWHTSP
jgi:SAM-dependent methyltransferase